ncbi:MAG TPA: hypothetical protein VGM88_13070 [Kofleriaceae bacterium]
MDAASAPTLADQLERAAAELAPALTPDLQASPNHYRGVTSDVEKLRPAAAAVRLFPACSNALQKVRDDYASKATTAEQLSAEIAAVREACNALDVAASTPMLGTLRDKVYPARQAVSAISAQLASDAHTRAVREERERAAAAISTTTVMGRFPEFSHDDAYRPERVAEAFARMPRELLVSEPAPERFGRANVERFPHERHAFCESGKGKDFSTVWYHNGQASMVKMVQPATSGEGAPMLVWSRDSLRSVFVSLDGLRYEALNSELPYDLLVKGLPEPAKWPTTPRDVCVDGEGLQFVVEHQLASNAAITKYQAADAALSRCIQRTWSGGDGAFEANATANITQSTRDNRNDALLDSYKSKVERACDGQRRAWQAAVVALSRDAATPRVELLAATRKALTTSTSEPSTSEPSKSEPSRSEPSTSEPSTSEPPQ